MQGETYAEWQQRRGMAHDLINWAILEYDEFMLDDRYDTQTVLDKIIARLRQFRDEQKGAGDAN